jgi:hypothetical protein
MIVRIYEDESLSMETSEVDAVFVMPCTYDEYIITYS